VLWNGQRVVLDMAIRVLGHPLVTRYRPALVLGALREDVWYVPLFGAVLDRPSLTHFYRPGLPGGLVSFLTPGPRWRADRLFERAVSAIVKAGPPRHSFSSGARRTLLTDMACPRTRSARSMISDSFRVVRRAETRATWNVCPSPPSLAARRRASELVEDLARHTQRFAPDTTNSPWGRVLWKVGLRRKIPVPILDDQARQLIPLAAGYAAALLRLFLLRAAGDAVTVGTASALETPAS
jgi:hypothetical protein